MSSEAEWIVVGAKGKPRKKQRTAHGAVAAGGCGAQQQQQHDRRPEPPLPQPCDAAAAAAKLPGWEAPAILSSPPATARRGRARAARTPEERLCNLAAAVAACAREVAAAPVFASLRAAMAAAEARCGGWRWAEVRRLVVYGVGCIEDSRVSRYQLALALLLKDLLPGLAAPPELYDPAFSELDRALLARLGLELIAKDEQGARAVEEPTLFFLPHLEAALCDNLLRANWSPERLPRVALLGNSFATYWERWSAPSGHKPTGRRPDHLLRLVEARAAVEVPVPDGGFHVASAFNDSSLHVFAREACATCCREALAVAAAVGAAPT